MPPTRIDVTAAAGAYPIFVGSGTHPGVGIPMVLVSGELAARRVADLVDRT